MRAPPDGGGHYVLAPRIWPIASLSHRRTSALDAPTCCAVTASWRALSRSRCSATAGLTYDLFGATTVPCLPLLSTAPWLTSAS